MLRSYLLSIWRNISRNKTFTFLNISGLAIGMMACMLIAQFVVHELSYDQFWPNSDRIFRLQLDRYNKGELTTRWAGGALGIGPDLKANFPEVKDYVRLTQSTALLSVAGDNFIKEDGVYYASEDFFKVFGYSLSTGVDSTALKESNSIVLSRKMVKKYFGDTDPMGKTIMNKKMQYQVTGIFEHFPANTHVRLDALQSFSTYAKLVGRSYESQLTSWQWDGFLTRITISPGLVLIGVSTVALLGILTIGSQTWRAAGDNPVNSLRYE